MEPSQTERARIFRALHERPGAFVIPVTEEEQLLESIRRKLVLEIAGTTDLLVPVAAEAAVDCLVGERLRRVWEREP